MANKPPNFPQDSADDRFAEQVARFFNEPIEQQELGELQKRLTTDASARRFFVRVACIDGLMSEQALHNEHALPAESDLLHDSSALDTSQLSLHDATVLVAIRDEDIEPGEQPITLPVSEPNSNQSQGSSSAFSFPLITKISAAAAILLIGVLVAFFAFRDHAPRQIAHVQPPTPPSDTIVGLQLPPGVRIGAQVRAEWGIDSPALAAGAEVPDQPLQLKSGWVRLDFPSGVAAVVEAPAKFQVQSASNVTMELGRISAEVPPAGHGFSIESPTCRVVDLGTGFGVSVNKQGQSEVQVFKGKVTFARKSTAQVGGQDVVQNDGQDGTSEVLTQGEGRRVDSPSGVTATIVAEPKSFVAVDQFNRWVSSSTTGLDKWRTFNEQLSRDQGLILFYTFDDVDPKLIKNHALRTTGLYDLPMNVAHGPSQVVGRMPGLPALDFAGAKHQYLILPNCPIPQTGQVSGAAWINVRTYVAYGSIIKNWGDQKSGVFHLGLANVSEHLEIELDGKRPGGPTVTDPTFVPINQWVHVAFVSDGTTARLYRDGTEVASAPSRLCEKDGVVSSMGIGCKPGDDGLNPIASGAAGFWDGQIGEIALFDRALTPAEVLRLSQNGRP